MGIKTTNDIILTLQKKDIIFEKLFNRYGLIKYEDDSDIFSTIVFHIVSQMLSLKVADVIKKRIISLCDGNVCSEKLLILTREQLRACGISYSKADYILDFAFNYSIGKYDFKYMKNLSDNEIINYLRQIKGVGLWTAEMISLFSLGKNNIFSYDDVALRNGIMKAKGFKTLSKKRFEMLRKKYSPYCSFASLYFYEVNDDKEYE